MLLDSGMSDVPDNILLPLVGVELRAYDVVLTTYGTLVTEFPKPERKKKKRRIVLPGEEGSETEDEGPAPPQKVRQLATTTIQIGSCVYVSEVLTFSGWLYHLGR